MKRILTAIMLISIAGCGSTPQLVSVQASGNAAMSTTWLMGEHVIVQDVQVSEVALTLEGAAPDAVCTLLDVRVSLDGLEVQRTGAVPGVSAKECMQEAGGPYQPFRIRDAIDTEQPQQPSDGVGASGE